jgi:hypothetical protein
MQFLRTALSSDACVDVLLLAHHYHCPQLQTEAVSAQPSTWQATATQAVCAHCTAASMSACLHLRLFCQTLHCTNAACIVQIHGLQRVCLSRSGHCLCVAAAQVEYLATRLSSLLLMPDSRQALLRLPEPLLRQLLSSEAVDVEQVCSADQQAHALCFTCRHLGVVWSHTVLATLYLLMCPQQQCIQEVAGHQRSLPLTRSFFWPACPPTYLPAGERAAVLCFRLAVPVSLRAPAPPAAPATPVEAVSPFRGAALTAAAAGLQWHTGHLPSTAAAQGGSGMSACATAPAAVPVAADAGTECTAAGL